MRNVRNEGGTDEKYGAIIYEGYKIEYNLQ